MMELETGCSWQASRFVCRAVCCTTPVYKLGHTRELHGKKRSSPTNNLYIYIYTVYTSLFVNTFEYQVEKFHSFDFYSASNSLSSRRCPPPLFKTRFLLEGSVATRGGFLVMVFRGGGGGEGKGEGAVARIFLSTTLNVP